MSPLSYAPLRADAAGAGSSSDEDDDDVSTSPPQTLTVSTVAATVAGVGHHMLKVEGYSRLKRTHGKNGSCLKSVVFGAGGHTWQVFCYLNGESAEDAGFISLFLAPVAAADGGVVHAEFTVELLRHQGVFERLKPSYVQRGLARPFRVRRRSNGTAVNAWGMPKFISTKDLERSSFLRDDCFAIRCTVTVIEEWQAEEEEVKMEDMDRLGLVCACEDDACELKHERPAETLWERIALFSRFLCGEASS